MKEIIITVLNQNHQRPDWYFDFNGEQFRDFIAQLDDSMQQLGVKLDLVFNQEHTININSYADLLNCLKLSSSDDRHHRHCVGHIIGKSEQLDIMDDLAKAVKRLAFAPETIAPDAEFARVCHNCGCGC